jgi:hypothetical protein
LAAFVSGSPAKTVAMPLLPAGAVNAAVTPSTVFSGTTTSQIYLPTIVCTYPPPAVYWGALVEAQAPSTANMQPGGVFDIFETRAQKKMSILHWGQPWKMNGSYQAFYAPWFDNVRNHGSIPLLDWGSWHLGAGINQPDFKLSAIYNGNHDTYIQQWALAAKAWGHPFFLRFDWEMNGDWQFPWSEQLNGNQSGDYIKAWRHVHDIFTQNGVANVTWVWCPNISSPTTRALASLYPGDAYVDWTCLDGYNKYPVWLDFNTLFTGSGIDWLYNSYAEVLAVAPGKPIMLGEFASLEAGDGGAKKAAWIKDALDVQLPTRFPQIKAVAWFNWDDNNPAYTFPIESSSPALSAFAAAIKSSYYAANDFANLDTSPIPPLP